MGFSRQEYWSGVRARTTLSCGAWTCGFFPNQESNQQPLDHQGSARPSLSITSSVNPSLTLQVVSSFFLITVIILIIIVSIYGVLIMQHLTYIISFHFHKSKKCRDLDPHFTDGETQAYMADKSKQCDSRACRELPCMVFPRVHWSGGAGPGPGQRPPAALLPSCAPSRSKPRGAVAARPKLVACGV